MPKRSILIIVFLSLSVLSKAQNEDDILVSMQFDLIKTDYAIPFSKAQFGIEGNYLFDKKFSGTLGFDVWTQKEVSVMIGARFYPQEHTFVRMRAFIGNNDFSVGGGWRMPINAYWKFEAMGDFYFSIDFAIRAGLVYIIRR